MLQLAATIIIFCISNLLFFNPGDVLKELFSVEPEKEGNRFNDCKCDRLGRFWGGTLCPPTSYQPPFPTEGSLYSFDGGETSTA